MELELVWLPRFCKRFRDNALMTHRSETLGHMIFYTVRLSVIRDRTDIEGSDNEMRDSEEDAGQKRSRT
jgi:hypothetical protein